MNIQLTLASRYLMGRKLRTSLTTLAVVFGVMLIFGLNGMIPAFVESFRQNMLAAAGQVDLAVSSTTGAIFPMTVVEQVQSITGVAEVTSLLSHPIALPTDQTKMAQSLIVTGIDPASAYRVRAYTVESGRLLEVGDNNAMLISQNMAEQQGLGVGDIFTLPSADGSRDFTIVGIQAAAALPGSNPVYIPLATAQELFNEIGRVNLVEAIFAAESDAEAVKAAVQNRLGDGYQLEGMQSGTELLANLQLGQVAFNFFGVMALIMGGFIIFNTFRTSVAERRRDIGMLRAVGASQHTILSLVLVESLLQGVVGTAAGILAGYGLMGALLALARPVFEQYLRLNLAGPSYSLTTFLFAIGLGVGVTVIGGLMPALSASRVTPMDALRPVTHEVDQKTVNWSIITGAILVGVAILTLLAGKSEWAALGSLLFVIGLVMVAPALIYPIARIMGGLMTLVFAREGQIAQGNLARQPDRAAITTSAMMIGLAILVAMVGMISSIFDGFLNYLDRSLRADFLLMPPSLILTSGNVGATSDLAQQIKEMPNIASVTTLRVSRTLTDKGAIQVLGIDPVTYPAVSGLEFTAGEETKAYTALGSGRNLIVNGIFAAQHQVSVGDEMALRTPTSLQTYQVVGIASDYLNAKLATSYISQANLAADFDQTTDLLIMAEAKDGVDLAGVEADLQQIVAKYPAFTLFASADWRETQQQTLNGSLGIMYFLMTALAVPSLIALVNTLAINVLERTREIGMIRAVGGTQKQIRRMILAESLLLTATGTGFGILAGVWLGYALVSGLNISGFVIPYYFPYLGVVVTVAVGLLFGVVAALLPARQAAQLEIVTALRYE